MVRQLLEYLGVLIIGVSLVLEVKYVSAGVLPQGHTWALVTVDGVTTAYVSDGAALRVARAIHARSAPALA